MKRKPVILVVASSGGHLTQAMCATSTVELPLVLVTNKNMLEDSPFTRIHTIRDTQTNLLIHAVNVISAGKIILQEKPQAIFSTGGPICLPFALLAKLTGTRFVYLDTLSRVTELSNSGKFIKRFGLFDSFLCQWQETAEKHGAEYHGQAFNLGDNGYQ